ncbi:CubicO group peptidase (beta-lactamase class C family) [Luteibacter rhizovicinus]|uniref:CubicO group peptidase (Beta-lactamase class C family) n=1 Tax=Luteibacter rhizovicinus TaxID=242606 RepID=A0A4R3YJT8_9GAMM|nr:serine hydrolase domain-containing protein [Luteibacter rhizovicinus]TCV92727.1 CubicO group peptidase (beta-lactamase class C family) [Luteibacter rhizovicinus]
MIGFRRGRDWTGAVAVILLCLASARMTEAAVLPEATPESQGLSAVRLQRLHEYMRKATDAEGYPGGVSLVMRNGRIVDWQAYGYRDIARHDAMRKDTIFRIYSMTKTVTSVAVMMLVEEGKITLEDPVSRYLPGFSTPQVFAGGNADAPRLRPAARPITIHALLTHTAGYPASLKGDEEAVKLMERTDPHGASDLRGFAERMSRVPLAADPGTRFGYDGASTELLARVVEVASGESFEAFLRQRIFDPLRMPDTDFSVPVSQRMRVVDITTMDKNGKLTIADGASAAHPGEPLNAYTSGAGGLYSTAGDYARFAQMLLNGGTLDGQTLLGRKTVELMMQNHLTMLNPPVTQFSDAEGFGIGGYVVIDVAKRGQLGSLGQYGWTGAASTYYTIDPKEHLVAILMLQHLPRDDVPKDLPRISRNFYNLVYQALLR